MLGLILLGLGGEAFGLASFGPQWTPSGPPIGFQKLTHHSNPEQGLERNSMEPGARGTLVAPLPEHARGPPIARGPDTMVLTDAPAAGPPRGLLPGNTKPAPPRVPLALVGHNR